MAEAGAAPTHDELVATMTGGMARPDLPALPGSARLRADGRPRPEFRAAGRAPDGVF